MARPLLLEIGCEEIPSRFFPQVLGQIKQLAAQGLSEERLAYVGLAVYATPRRLVLYIESLAEKQEDLQEKVKGPSVAVAFDDQGAPTKAALGFARSRGVEIGELHKEKVNGTEYLFALTKIKGKDTVTLLPSFLTRLVGKISFPKPMYWEGRGGPRFARPIRWLLALYGEEQIPFTYGGLTAGRQTRGHRFLAPFPLEARDPRHYFKIMEEGRVILDPVRRKQEITTQAEKVARLLGGRPLIDADLLEEVNYLVEYPVALTGAFNKEFLDLPREVLITTMQVHQRYFPVVDEQDGLLPYFVVISNTAAENGDRVRRGNEKVLRARLSDARFFFQEDTRQSLAAYGDRLKSIVFHKELGTLWEKRQRIMLLSRHISLSLGLSKEETARVERIAALCKNDLATSMVGEFPELQGVMGREYALLSGEETGVATGIFEHYLPRYQGDSLPLSLPGAVVSLADKLDTIAGCFKAGIEPTGSQDPYALRRQAQGIVTVLMEKAHSLDLGPLIKQALELYASQEESLVGKITELLKQRVRYSLEQKGFTFDLTEAVLAGEGSLDPFCYLQKALALSSLVNEPYYEDVLTAFNRVSNLARQGEPGIEPQEALFREQEEKSLFQVYCSAVKVLTPLWEKGDLTGYMRELAALRHPVDLFFDAVLVMDEDEELRRNRLALLRVLKELFLRVADFGKLNK